jgi:hypothetical protein
MSQPKVRKKAAPLKPLRARVESLEERMARAEGEIRMLASLPGRMQELSAQMLELTNTVRGTLAQTTEAVSRLDADVIHSRETVLKAIGALRPCAESMGRAVGLMNTEDR